MAKIDSSLTIEDCHQDQQINSDSGRRDGINQNTTGNALTNGFSWLWRLVNVVNVRFDV